MLQDQIRNLLDEIQQAERIDRHLQDLKDQLDRSYYELAAAEKKLNKEFKDIEQLEKMSVKGLFHKVLGSKEEQIEKERQEYLQASLKYDEAKKSCQLLEYERDLLQKKLVNIPKLKRQLETLLKQREKVLIDKNTKVGQQILDLVLRMDTHDELVSNLRTIIGTGEEALTILQRMIRHLQNAKNWGQWDMTGNRRSASYMKHSAIDKAKDMSYQVKHLLARYQNDLRQIYRTDHFDLNLHFDSFNRFTDIFFDNLISDWIIQQKIQNALANVISTRDRVQRINQSLTSEISKSQDKVKALEERRRELILSS